MLKPIVGLLEDFYILYSRFFKGSLADHIDIKTTFDEHTFATETGVLVTPLRYLGMKRMLSGSSFAEMIQGLNNSMGAYFESDHHRVQWVYQRDYDNTINTIHQALTPAYQASKRLKIDFGGLLKAREAHLSKSCVSENIYVSLITYPNVFNRVEKAQYSKKRKARIASRPPAAAAQQPDFVYPELYEPHASFVRSVMNDMQGYKADVEHISVRNMLREIRAMTSPEFTDESWQPSLPGDVLPLRMPRTDSEDISTLLWPLIGDQLFMEDGGYADSSTVTIGGRSYTSIYIDLPPKDVQTFPQLLKRIRDISLPFRVAIDIGGGGLWKLNVKKFFSSVIAFTDSGNKEIVAAINGMQNAVNKGAKGVVFQMALTTWAPSDQLPLLKRRVSELVRAVQGWGGCGVQIERGDPASGFASTLPAASLRNIGEVAMAPFADVLKMLPLTSQSSPWQRGTVLFKTLDNKISPYQPASSLQQVCIDLFVAVTRSGKSVLANTLCLGYVLNGASSNLPYVSIIEIAPSSEGLISLIQDRLPRDKRHLALYRRLRFSEEDSINVFDTQLGCRFPLGYEKSFLVNFLTLLVTPVELDTPYPNTTELVKAAIDETYKTLSDNHHPKRYDKGVDCDVDAVLSDIGYALDDKTSWWEVVDALFDHGRIREAYRAQRYAVPVITDIISVTQNSAAIKAQFGDIKVVRDTEQSLVSAFIRALGTVATTFPNLSKPTRLDLGEARVVSLDLQEVAPRGGDEADRQTAIMYMTARHVLMNKFFLTIDHVREISPRYQGYHNARIKEIMSSVKRVFLDEFHRTKNAPKVREQFDRDVLEGGKAGIHMSFASQSIAHFTEDMIKNATNVFLLNLGDDIDQVAARLRLSEGEVFALKTRVNGPTADGCPFLMRFRTPTGLHTQLLKLSSPAGELWALSSSPQDVALRRYLYSRLGSEHARQVLAKHFPSGSARAYFEQRQSYEDHSTSQSGEVNDSLIERIGNELLEKESEEIRYAAN